MGGQDLDRRVYNRALPGADNVEDDAVYAHLQVAQKRLEGFKAAEPVGRHGQPHLFKGAIDQVRRFFACAGKSGVPPDPSRYQRLVLAIEVLPGRLIAMENRSTKELKTVTGIVGLALEESVCLADATMSDAGKGQ
jgi:hypothetical protein